MGQLRTEPYSVAEGREYAAYLDHVQAECNRLVGIGRLPDTDDVAWFTDLAGQVGNQIRRDVDAAGALSQTSSAIPMTAADYSRMRTMNDSMRNLLEILEMRQALALNRTPACARVSDAVQNGTFIE